MVKTVGEQLFDILREGHGAITARDICGLVRYQSLQLNYQKLEPSLMLQGGRRRMRSSQSQDEHLETGYT